MYIELKTWNTRRVILRGEFASHKKAIEYAINQGISLDYLMIEDCDLSNGNFDGGSFSYARFNNCNFDGANLSESSFIKSQFIKCCLNNTALTDSNFIGSSFENSSLRNCEALYTDFRGIVVTCPYFLKSDFRHTAHFSGACFMSKGNTCPMSQGPIFIRGLGMDLVLLDEHVVVGSTIIIRKDQVFDKHGTLSPVFSDKGLKPNNALIEQLWESLRMNGYKSQKIA